METALEVAGLTGVRDVGISGNEPGSEAHRLARLHHQRFRQFDAKLHCRKPGEEGALRRQWPPTTAGHEPSVSGTESAREPIHRLFDCGAADRVEHQGRRGIALFHQLPSFGFELLADGHQPDDQTCRPSDLEPHLWRSLRRKIERRPSRMNERTRPLAELLNPSRDASGRLTSRRIAEQPEHRTRVNRAIPCWSVKVRVGP